MICDGRIKETHWKKTLKEKRKKSELGRQTPNK
jgi:hypothetical protein